MQLTTRGRYAVMAMVELASREAAQSDCGRPICLSEIAASQHLSLAYLEQLFALLRRDGLICSVRGPGGGYRLARAASAISIAEIVAAVHEPLQATRCEVGGPSCMTGLAGMREAERCQTHDLWVELGRQIRFFLRGITLADVLAGRVAGRAMSEPIPAQAAE